MQEKKLRNKTLLNRLASFAGCAAVAALIVVPTAAAATLITPKPEKATTVNPHVVQAPAPAPSPAPSSPSSAGAPAPSGPSQPPVMAVGEAPTPSVGNSSPSGGDLSGNPFADGDGRDSGDHLSGNPFETDSSIEKLEEKVKEFADLLISALWGKNQPPQLPSPEGIQSSTDGGPTGGFVGGGTDPACPGMSVPMIIETIEDSVTPEALC
jgi:hypothetical protein